MRCPWHSWLLLSASGGAQESKESKACFDKANTQMDMNVCADDELKRADGDLNQAYQGLLAKLKADSVATQKLRAAQRAWLGFRDAHLEELFPGKDKSQYGSVYPMASALASAEVTRERTRMLDAMLHPKEGDVGGNPH